MTRINLVPPEELADQHLFAEFREIKMIGPSLKRSLGSALIRHGRETPEEYVQRRIPTEYVLGKGHVSFFYDKGTYLIIRYQRLRDELLLRGYNINSNGALAPLNEIHKQEPWNGYYNPTPEALVVIRARIAERIAKQPSWYRWTSRVPPVNMGLCVAAGSAQGHTVYKLA